MIADSAVPRKQRGRPPHHYWKKWLRVRLAVRCDYATFTPTSAARELGDGSQLLLAAEIVSPLCLAESLEKRENTRQIGASWEGSDLKGG